VSSIGQALSEGIDRARQRSVSFGARTSRQPIESYDGAREAATDSVV
jgi:hypothetical protein